MSQPYEDTATRPFRSRPREVLAQLIRDLERELQQSRELSTAKQAENDALDAELWTETRTLFGGVKRVKSGPTPVQQARINQVLIIRREAANHQSALMGEIRGVKFELHVRDTPELLEKLGSGFD